MNHAHRIGQSKGLVVYRLVVCAGVEERILQLAKRKLMLDHLFVNKSESQKEVEDILRWGTDELFSGSFDKGNDENDASKDETVPHSEKRSKRRTGGLGDVYQDKCIEGSSKIIWDENAILKLLDRSNFQVGSPYNFESDLENDMLGSVKTMEWTDMTMKKIVGGKENVLDKLRLDREEECQNKEEVALGRGKHPRKAVSYKESFAPKTNQALLESGSLDEQESESEPEKEYTPSGRAHKVKFGMLRARQKERLAQRITCEQTYLGLGSCNPKFFSECPRLSFKNRDKPSELQPSKNTGISAQKDGRLPKSKKFCGPRRVERSSTSDGVVLALYAPDAPDAPQRKSTNRNSSRSLGRINKQGNQSNYPFNTSGCSGSGSKALKSCCSDALLPFPMNCSPLMKRKFPDSLQSSSASSAGFLEKIGSSKFPTHDTMLPNNPPTTLQNPGPDFLANLSWGSRQEPANVHPPSSLPDLNLPLQNISYFKQEDLVEWSEHELDCLWIGVKRYGMANWDAILNDPAFSFSKFKTANTLALRWEEDLCKMRDAYAATSSGVPKKLHHIFANLPPTKYAGIRAENHAPFQNLGFGIPPSSVFGNISTQSSDNPPLNQPNGYEIQLEDELVGNKYQKVPGPMDRSLAISDVLPPASSSLPNLSSLKGKEIAKE